MAQKKLDQEEGRWEEVKEILGWTVNGANYMIQLPPNKVEKIINQLVKIQTFHRKIPHKALYKVAGSFDHTLYGIPGGTGLFSPIQKGLKGSLL